MSHATVRILMRAAGPVTHGQGTEGNEQIIKREPVRTPFGTRLVPTLTGNSLRHRLLREPLANHLVDAWDLAGHLTKEQVRWLFNAGAMGGEHGTSLDRVAKCQSLLPMAALLGLSLPDTILPGRLSASFAWLVCQETVATIKADVPADWWPERDKLASAESFVSRGTYYRHDAAKHRHDLVTTAERELPPEYKGMPHAGERVNTGSEWYLRLDVDRPTDVVLGALFFGLSEWHRGGATVGGQSSRGHGVMQPSIDTGGLDPEPLIAAYLAHVEEVRDAGREFVLSLYKSTGEPKAAKAKGGKSR